MIDRGQKIFRAADALDRVFAAFVGGTNEAASFNSATSPDIREGSRPVIATRLYGACGAAGITCTGARRVLDLWCTTELAGDHY